MFVPVAWETQCVTFVVVVGETQCVVVIKLITAGIIQ